jgi:hypothetical protein
LGHDELDILILNTLGIDLLTIIFLLLLLLGLRGLTLLAVVVVMVVIVVMVVVVVVIVIVVVIVVVTGVLTLGVSSGELGGSSLLGGSVDVLDLSLTKDTDRIVRYLRFVFSSS